MVKLLKNAPIPQPSSKKFKLLEPILRAFSPSRLSYQIRCCRRGFPISHHVIIRGDSFTTFPQRLALVLKFGCRRNFLINAAVSYSGALMIARQ